MWQGRRGDPSPYADFVAKSEFFGAVKSCLSFFPAISDFLGIEGLVPPSPFNKIERLALHIGQRNDS